jgi:hypothetical protein
VTAYRILLAIDLLTAGVFAWFFLLGLSDGSVCSFNIGLWLAILLGLAAVIGGGMTLRHRSSPALGAGLLALVGVPALLAGAFFLLLILSNPRWN